MRQAGRYMADYRALRERHSLLELCRTPELAARITLQPVDAIDVDAAIIFSDLLLPFEPMGLAFDFVKGEGPRVEQPLRTEADIERLRLFEPREGLGYVLDAIAMARRELDGRVPLIGFAGAPFTLASYAIEGGPSRDFARTKALMYGHPEAWHRLCDRLAQVVSAFVVAQVEAGAQAIQIFDSWVGALSAEDYREFASPHTAKVFAALKGDRRPDHSFRHRDVDDSARPRRGRRGRHRRRLAPAHRRRLGTARRDLRRPGQSRPDAPARSRAIACSAPPRTSCSGPPGGPATSSTSVTASCPRRRSSTSRCSPGSCTGSAPPDECSSWPPTPRPSPSTSPWSAADSPA